ncbi:hypothetical protein M440DRAFT_1404088 [Trichoderma longibrachiatum ATCC 18648]|uniref:Uncharacterized protein n=1 Tax=Trichoderma longibrachiatum ATCC 18648 TaxID=983965 RepID=A0A2T4BX94_TRILO|nr:hypothetical protein M440DRAFT_1404088 [Trichoderma longibrachiatum ATCC 18648]
MSTSNTPEKTANPPANAEAKALPLTQAPAHSSLWLMGFCRHHAGASNRQSVCLSTAHVPLHQNLRLQRQR